jgi:hypothetical protein
MTDAVRFALQLEREFEDKKGEIIEVVKNVTAHALRRIVQRSPVDTGQFKANWYTSIGRRYGYVTKRTDYTGQLSISRGMRMINQYGVDNVIRPIYIQNSLPYASRLENGYSTQAPSGIVRTVIPEINAMLARVRL